MASFSIKDLEDSIELSDDEFGNRIADGRRNNLDIASQYRFTPERLRLFLNDSREFVQYGDHDASKFDDNTDHWALKPAGGDTMRLESAESGTYVVNYTMSASWAFKLNQSLADGDALRFGPRNTTDGWFVEQRGADHTDTQADIKELSGGDETTLASDVTLPKPTTGWHRYECTFGWYAVLNQVWKQTYTIDGTVFNEEFAATSNDGSRGPETGNLNLYIEIEADASTSDLILEAGSMGMVTLGSPTSLNRNKPQLEQETVSGTNNAWEPVLALRVNPNDTAVNSQFAQLDILDYGANDNLELIAASFDANKTDASEWQTPGYHHNQNSALQTTTNVSQVANSTGVVKDFGTGDKFGGFTVAAAVDIDGGASSGSAATVNQNRQEKKSVLNSDHVVMLARTGTVDQDVSFVWDADQNW